MTVDSPDKVIEALVAETERLRAAYNVQVTRVMRFKLERDAVTKVADSSPSAETRAKAKGLAANFEEK